MKPEYYNPPMIKVGIKTGPQDWLNRFTNTNAHYCEVWYRFDQPSWYDDQFGFIAKQGINAGLHFWGVVDGFETNIAYPGPTHQASLEAIKTTIDVAASNNHVYVNIHGGNRRLIKIDLDTREFSPDPNSPEISLEDAQKIQGQSIQELHQYALDQGVLLLTETVPAQLATGPVHIPDSRLKPQYQSAMPVQSLIKHAQANHIYITNDFCHTFADQFDKPLSELKHGLIDNTAKLAPYTKLLHVNTVIPPYNGTDSHHGITSDDFSIEGIFPDEQTLIQLLSFFKDRDDVWAICEPNSEHDHNYRILQKLVANL